MKIMSETLWSNFRQVTSKNSATYTQKANRIERDLRRQLSGMVLPELNPQKPNLKFHL